MSIEGRTLRAHLKTATAGQHDALDLAMADMALTEAGPYGHFLAIQYAARLTIEEWLADAPPPGGPVPRQTDLIAKDLHDLRIALPVATPAVLPDGGDTLGVAWLVAGSSLGNRTLAARRGKLGIGGPQRFLTDAAMPTYFKQLLPRLSVPLLPQQAQSAIIGAQAGFAVFEQAMVQQDIWCAA